MSNAVKCVAYAIIMVVMVAYFALGATSPVGKGSILITGEGSYFSRGGDLYESGSDRFNSLTLQTSVGAFISTGLHVGGQILVQRISQGQSRTGYAIGPKIGYVFSDGLRSNVKGSVLPQLTASFFHQSVSESGITTTGNAFIFSGGILYFVSRSVGLTLDAVYQAEKVENTRGNTFGVQAGFAIFLWE